MARFSVEKGKNSMFLSPINQSISPLHRAIREAIRKLNFEITDEMLEENAARGHDPKSLPTLVRALDNAKDYELPLLLASIEAIINLAPEAYFVLSEENKAKIARHFSPPVEP